MTMPLVNVFGMILATALGISASAIAQPHAWPVYSEAPREYLDDGYYYASKPVHYPYYAPARYEQPEVYGRIPYPYYYDPYGQFEEDPMKQDERLASLPVGQETWYENEPEQNWRNTDLDDVNAAFLDNLILTQMARDAERRRENARSEYENNWDSQDEDVRELKALAGKPLYHVAKTGHNFDEDYPSDEGFINWNGNKRSVSSTAAPTSAPQDGQKEVAVPRPAPTRHHDHGAHQEKKEKSLYDTIAHMLAVEKNAPNKVASNSRRLDKRFVSSDNNDLVAELRGLKHRIAT